MKILALLASPRKGSNTDITAGKVLEGAASKGHVSESIHLYDYEIKPCIDCRACKKGKLVCVLKDDMPRIYEKMDDADCIVFATPNYWFGPSAVMKLAQDRMRPYASNKKMQGKKALVVAPAGAGPDACGPMIESYKMAFDYLGMEYLGCVLPKAFEKAQVLEDEAILKQAFDLGASI